MAINMTPSQLDPVFSADTPITPDPPLGKKGSSKGYATREAMIARLVAAGVPPAEAARTVDAELARSGPRPIELFNEDNTPEAIEALRQRESRNAGRKGRQAQFESNYNEATGMPVPAAVAPRASLPAAGPEGVGGVPLAMTEPGVRMPDGSRVTPSQAIYDEDEAQAYNIRTPNGPGWYNPSGRDKAMMARGYVPVMNQDGTVSYRLGPGGEVDGLPGAPGRGGRREDLEAPLLKADGTPVLDGNGNPVPRFRVQNMSGPLSENNSVYVQSDEARAKQAAYMKERQLYRDAQIQGVSPATLLAQSPGDYGDLTAGGQRDRVGARAANEGARQAAAAKREEAWRSQMMLAGRNPAKNAVNAYNALNDPNTNDWQRAVMANALRPDMNNTTPMDVAAAHNAQLTQLGLRVAMGQGFQPMDPTQQELLQQKVDAGKPLQVRAREAVAAGQASHPDVQQYADDLVHQHYSSRPGVLGVSTHFTDNEVMIAAQRLADDTGLPIAEAEKLLRRIQQDRNRNAQSSSLVGWMYNQ